ncbi:GTP-binding protein [Streptomyces sp. WMMC500]|uniref:GTP-binding protein n=1 Tax=Streptomyces sp. WMMC500 TaxID=3015154 RepID=UPI00248BCBE5|nr:GTP-binding protein [Streptomyces sp. WMMC500]WBB61892.1 GTP-binding protein [Streptomyces sp. WMMC500]
MTKPTPLPVVVAAGLHRQARTAAVESLLRAVPGAVAVHHDLDAIEDDRMPRTVRDADGVRDRGRPRMSQPCACCAVRDDLIPTLLSLAVGRAHPLAVIDLWDSVEPQAIAELIAAAPAEAIELTGVLTALDTDSLVPYLTCGDDLTEQNLALAPTDRRTVADTFARQLEYPTLLALTCTGTPEPADIALLDQLHHTAHRLPLHSPELARAALTGFDADAAAARLQPASALLPQEADAHGVATLVWHRTRPLHPGRLYTALEDITCAALRSRGRLWLADRPDALLSWDATGGALCIEHAGPWLAALPEAAWELEPAARRVAAALDWHPEHGDRAQHLTFTTPDLDHNTLRRTLDSCLLTDDEYTAGPHTWRTLSTAFDALLGVPA